MRKFGHRSLRIATVVASLGLTGLSSDRATATPADETQDASAAVRYDTSSGSPEVIGEIQADIWDEDDDAINLSMPFPINFFGEKFTNACVTTNGLIYPANLGDSCSNDFDDGLGVLAIGGSNPLMAVLALDLDGSETHLLADGRDAAALTGSVNNEVLSSEVLTVSSVSHGLIAGDHVAFVGTGTILDGGGSYSVNVVDPDTFTITLPSVTDLDPNSGGVVTATTGNWVYSNGVGARAVYVGETTVDGKPAFVVTWYRYPHNDAYNPSDRSSTLQLVLIKENTGDAATGWDFTVEYNIGTMTDDEDGYQYDDPTNECTAWGTYWNNPSDPQPTGNDDMRDTCRWGMGFASYVGNIALSSIAIANGIATLATAAPHGIDGTGVGVWLDLPSSLALGDLSGEAVLAEVTDGNTFRIDTSASVNPALFASLGALASDVGQTDLTNLALVMEASDMYELFGESSIAELVDSAGATALVRNSLNSPVFGRYRFGMGGGSVVEFAPPSMDGTPTVATAVPSASPTPPPPPPTTTTQPLSTSTSVPPSSTSTVPVPVPVDQESGVLPELEPGESQVLIDGVFETVEIVVEEALAGADSLVVRSDDFELRLNADCEGDCRIRIDPTGRQVLELEDDGSVAVQGEGFLAGTPVYVWMFSDPTYLGELTVLADGTFGGSLPVPALGVGSHTLQVNGTSLDGKTRSANLGVEVKAPPSQVSTTVPTPDVVALPATGSDGMSPVVWWALVVVALGGLIATTRRRTA